MSTETVAAAIPAAVDTAAATVPAAGGGPDVPVTPVETPQTPETDVVAKRAVTLEEVRAARKAAEASKAATTETPKTETPKTDAPKIDVKPDEVTQFARLSKELREAKAALKAAEAKGSVAGVAEKVQKLIAEGKHLEAMAAAGINLDAAVTQQLSLAPGADASGKTDAEKKLEDLERRFAEQDKTNEQRNAEASAARVEQAVKIVGDHVTKNAAEFKYLARNPEWVKEAYLGAETAYAEITKDGATLTAAQKDKLVLDALALAEKRHAATAKLYAESHGGDLGQGAKPTVSPPQTASAPATFDASMRGGTVRPAVKGKLTWDELRTRRRQEARAHKG
jgi:hypothetical protein